ncbi:MAG: IPExxxVDY family protein [Bacteroidetes bacterium]|nr:IPExxxVDY family protein [Bacteroidota bacterium]
MKTTRLIVEHAYDFEVLGLISSAKEYKIVWSINKILNINMIKQKDISFDFLTRGQIKFSNYLFETEHSSFVLLKNKSCSLGNTPPDFPDLKCGTGRYGAGLHPFIESEKRRIGESETSSVSPPSTRGPLPVSNLPVLPLLGGDKEIEVKNPWLLPEAKQYDYIIRLKGILREHLGSGDRILNAIRTLPIVQYISKLNVESLRSKENLIF